MQYKGTVNLMNIARGTGMSLKVDASTQRVGYCARVYVNVDCFTDLPEKILVQRKKASFDFFANLYYEFVPHFCHSCRTLGYKMKVCRGSRQVNRPVENTRRTNMNMVLMQTVAQSVRNYSTTVQPKMLNNVVIAQPVVHKDVTS